MNKNEKLLIIINSAYNLAYVMTSVFVNVYLYAYTKSLVVMTLYCIIRIGLFPLFFTIAGKWASKKSFTQTLSMGLILIMTSLMFILFAKDAFEVQPSLVFVVAMLVGSGEGFFWLSINSLNQLVSSVESRAKYVGNIGIFNNIASIASPIIASFLISIANNDFEGYISIFKVVLVIYFIIILFAFKVKVTSSRQPFAVIKRLSLKGDRLWKYCMISTIFYGIRDSLILTLAGLLVYNATNSQGSLYSQLLVVFSIIGIVAYYFVSRRFNKNNQMKFYNVGAFLIASSTIVLVLVPNVYGAIYYGIMNAIATPLYGNPYSIIMMNSIAEYAKDENIVGRVIVKETYLSIGRCFGMIMIVLAFYILPENLYLQVSVLFCSMFPIILVMYANYYRKRYNIG